MRNKRPSPISKYVFKACKSVTRLIYSKMKIIGIEDIPSENTVIVANHAQLSGPIIAELYMPENCFIWANGQMMSYKDVPEYCYRTLGKKVLQFNIDCKITILDIMQSMSEIADPE